MHIRIFVLICFFFPFSDVKQNNGSKKGIEVMNTNVQLNDMIYFELFCLFLIEIIKGMQTN